MSLVLFCFAFLFTRFSLNLLLSPHSSGFCSKWHPPTQFWMRSLNFIIPPGFAFSTHLLWYPPNAIFLNSRADHAIYCLKSPVPLSNSVTILQSREWAPCARVSQPRDAMEINLEQLSNVSLILSWVSSSIWSMNFLEHSSLALILCLSPTLSCHVDWQFCLPCVNWCLFSSFFTQHLVFQLTSRGSKL